MGDKTEAEQGSDRRKADRRIAANADYTGPERRVRRSGEDRRKSPRF